MIHKHAQTNEHKWRNRVACNYISVTQCFPLCFVVNTLDRPECVSTADLCFLLICGAAHCAGCVPPKSRCLCVRFCPHPYAKTYRWAKVPTHRPIATPMTIRALTHTSASFTCSRRLIAFRPFHVQALHSQRWLSSVRVATCLAPAKRHLVTLDLL